MSKHKCDITSCHDHKDHISNKCVIFKDVDVCDTLLEKIISALTTERDTLRVENKTLKEALRLACKLLADDICPVEVVGEYVCPKAHMTHKRDASGELEECNENISECWKSNFLAQATPEGG